MAYTSLAVVLCLSLYVASVLDMVAGRDLREGSIDVATAEDPVTADEHHGEQKERVNGAMRSSSHPAASGLAELVQRVTLLSHALNQSRNEPIGGEEEGKVSEGLRDLVQRMILFSHALTLSTAEPLDSSSCEKRVFEGLVDMMKKNILLSRVLNLSIAEPKGSIGEQTVKEGVTELVDRMTRFPHVLNLSCAESEGNDGDQRVKEGLVDLVERMTLFSYALNRSSDRSTEGGDSGEEEKVRKGLADLVDRMTLFSYALNRSNDGSTEGGDSGEEKKVRKGLVDLVDRMILFSYALNRSSNESTGSGDNGEKEGVREGLAELMQRMVLFSQALNMSYYKPKSNGGSGGEEQKINEGLAQLRGRTMLSEPLTDDNILHLGSPANTTGFEPREQPCLPPFQLIAYRMCILQEMQLKLSWSDAQEFCRERGAELAEDMVVIKTRRFLNDLYGEDSTRTRWPVWVGGRRADRTWIWEGGQQVPEFLWAPSEPRVFSNYLAPEGQCMMLDGYRRFYGASLPCHLRRRFVCQLDN